MAVTLTYGGLDLNDGTTYTLLEGFDPGERIKTWDEMRSYSGTAAQYNVTEANLIPVSVPLRIQGTSLATLAAAIAAINALIDAGAQSLVYNNGGGSVTYSCAHSPRLGAPQDGRYQVKFAVETVLTLYRTP